MRTRPAGDFDYEAGGQHYATVRRADPRIAAAIRRAIGGASSLVNVGAGAGSYEPVDRAVVAVEPSSTMRDQRRPDAAPVVAGTAEALPFADGAFAAAMTTFSVHQWADLAGGLAEMRRVTRGPVTVLTCDPDLLTGFWLDAYAPEVVAVEARRYPSLGVLAAGLGGRVHHRPVPIPLRCTDGFNEAYYGRPEALLDPVARQSCSAWSFVGADVVDRFERQLRTDLDDGTWDDRWGYLRRQPTFAGSLVLVVSEPD